MGGTGSGCAKTAKRPLCSSSASVPDTNGKGVVLNMGRSKRLATEPQRRAIGVRYPYCIGPVCNWEARFCEPDYLDDWLLGGSTDVEWMVPLCIHHHRLVHERVGGSRDSRTAA
jgi:hypothetical protein